MKPSHEWHEDDPLALTIHDALVMQSKSLGNTLQTARVAKIAAEAARQHDHQAVEEARRLRAWLLAIDRTTDEQNTRAGVALALQGDWPDSPGGQ